MAEQRELSVAQDLRDLMRLMTVGLLMLIAIILFVVGDYGWLGMIAYLLGLAVIFIKPPWVHAGRHRVGRSPK